MAQVDIDKVAWLLLRDRKLVCALRSGKPYIINLGGKREIKADGTPETDLETLVRETKEETTADILAYTAEHQFTIEGFAVDGRSLREAYYTAEHVGVPKPAGEIAEFVELTGADIGRKDITPTLRDCLLRLRHLDLID